MMKSMRKKPEYLSEKEFNCLEIFIRTGNKRQAGIEAGYAEKSAGAQASRLINGKKGKRYLDERMAALDSEKIADSNEVLEYLTSVMRGEINDQFDLEPSLQERTKAAVELAKRTIDVSSENDAKVVINCNTIPRPSGDK